MMMMMMMMMMMTTTTTTTNRLNNATFVKVVVMYIVKQELGNLAKYIFNFYFGSTNEPL